MRHSDDAIVARLLSDLRAYGINISETEVRSKLLKYGRQAEQEIASRLQKQR